MTRTIDIHTHVLADATIKLLQKEVPQLALKLSALDGDNAALEVGGVRYTPFPRGGHDIARRFADMEAADADMHVLSVAPQTWAYNQEAAVGAAIATIQNDEIARLVREYPHRFAGNATLPMQAPAKAADELRRAMTKLGLQGAMIGSNIAGKNLDDIEADIDKDLKPHPYDLDRAKALLQQAGPPPANVEFIVNKGNVLREDFLTYTQAQLQKLGWSINAQAIEFATLIDRRTKKDFQVEGVDFVGVTVDPGELYDQFGTGGSGNYNNYSNPQLDDLLKKAKQELDIEKQKALYKQIQATIVDDLPFYFAWYRPFLHAVKKKFTGYVDSAGEYGVFSELETVSISG